jgi:hypothetical protein
MNSDESFLNFERLINLFSLFVFGTVSLILSIVIDKPPDSLFSPLNHGLFMLFLLCYEIVIITIAFHYLLRAKFHIIEIFNQNPNFFYNLIVVVIAITYLTISTIIEKSALVFIRDLLMLILIYLGLPTISKLFEKKNE